MLQWQIIPYLLSFSITASVAVFSWRRRSVKGALAYAWVAASQALWTLGYIFELSSPSLQTKIYWDDFQWIGAAGWMLGFLVFVYMFTEIRFDSPLRILALVSMPSIVFLVLVATNSYHGLIHTNEYLIPGEPWAVLEYEISTFVLIYAYYNYLASFLGLYLLARKFIRTHLLFRAQIGIITTGTLIPLLGTLFPIFDLRIGLHKDITPITFAISNLIVVYGLFRYRFLDIAPVAYRAVFDNLPDSVIIIDGQGRLVDFNPTALKVFPYLTTQVIGRQIREVFEEVPELVDQVEAMPETHTELRLSRAEGGIYQDVQVSQLRNPSKNPIGRVILFRDITEQHQAQNEAARYAEDLRAANEELKAFSYSVSHDLRAPLRAITGFVEILYEDNRQQLDQQGLDYLERVRAAGQKMNFLIEDLLRLSRVTSSEMEHQQVDLSQLTDEITVELRSSHPERQVTVEIAPGMSACCDPGLVRVLYENLIGNAWKFTGKAEEARIQIGMMEEAGETIFYVRDNGVGFDMTMAERMFDPFHRLHSATDFEGTGIGLATAQRIVRRHGGRVWFEAAPGEGATFYFTI